MSDQYYEIFIDIGDEKTDLISEIKSLKKPEKTEKSENEPLLLSNIKTKKKDKKEKKKSLALDLEIMNGGEIESLDSFINKKEEDNKESFKVKEFVSIDDLLNDRNDDDDKSQAEELLDEQCSGYSKLKKEANQYKKEFAEEITLLYNLLKDTNKFSKELEDMYSYITNNRLRERGMSKYTIDLANTILSATSNKIQILKEINNVKKTIQDLKLKSEKNKDEKTTSTEALASHYFKNLVNYGRSKFIKEYEGSSSDGDYDISEFVNLNAISDNESDKYMDLIEDRLDNLDIKLRSDEADKYIEYENMGVQIKIKKCIDTNEWNFIAVDRHNQQIPDYPTPTKKSAGTVKFSPDGNYATDEQGRTYSVIEYYSPDED